MQEFYNQLGSFLKQKRESAGLTHTRVASLIGLTRTSITNIESGQQRLLLHHAIPLMKILKIEICDLEEIFSKIKLESEIQKYNDQDKFIIDHIINKAREQQQ